MRILYKTSCSSLLETVDLPVPTGNLRDLTFFHVGYERRNCPYAGCASDANASSRDTLIYLFMKN